MGTDCDYTDGPTDGALVAKPNYRFQKQQRELKKSKQQEDKQRKKLARTEAEKAASTPPEPQKT